MPDSMAHRQGNPDRERDDEKRQPHSGAREQRKLREVERDPRLKRVRGAERGADDRRADARGHHRQRIDPESGAEDEQHWHERDDLLLHVLERAEGAEHERDEGKSPDPSSVKLPRDHPCASA